jgi:hypothetical protein
VVEELKELKDRLADLSSAVDELLARQRDTAEPPPAPPAAPAPPAPEPPAPEPPATPEL